MNVPLLRPVSDNAEIDAVAEVLNSGWWGMGPKCAEFEQELSRRTNYPYCVTVNSATAALHLACLALGIGPGDEVLVPSLTFVSTALAVKYTGATPIFVDVDPFTYCMDFNDAAKKRTARTKAIIPVDYGGYPAGKPNLDIPVIQDAAHNCGGLTYGDLVCYSFHPVKQLATGDGGAILTSSHTIDSQLRALRWCGIDRDTWQRTNQRYGWQYVIESVGYKCHWNDIQAAIGLVQLRKLEEANAERERMAHVYDRLFSDCDSIILPADHPKRTWHIYTIRVANYLRNRVIDALLAAGYSAGVHYKPIHQYPIWGQDDIELYITNDVSMQLITLPMWIGLTVEQQAQIAAIVIKEVEREIDEKEFYELLWRG